MRPISQIEEMLNRAYDLLDKNENPYFGMTYIDGVVEALSWALGHTDDEPIEEDV